MDCSRASCGLILIIGLLLIDLTWGQGTRQSDKLLSQRLRQLDAQFRTFQERTLNHLQNIAENVNVSQSIDTRFQILTRRYEGLSRELKAFKAATDADLSLLRAWTKKLQKKTKRLDLRITGLERSLRDNNRASQRQVQEQRDALSNLTDDLQEHMTHIDSIKAHQEEVRDGIRGLQGLFREQQAQMTRLEERMRERAVVAQPGPLSTRSVAAPREPPISNQTPQGSTLTAERNTKPQAKAPKQGKMRNHSPPAPRPTQRSRKAGDRRRLRNRVQGSRHTDLLEEPRLLPTEPGEKEDTEGEELPIQNILQLPLRHKIPHHTPRPRATICNVNSMLLFPSASTENYATFFKGFTTSIYELTICTWVRVESRYMGTLFSYATADNDNMLVLYGRNTSSAGSVDFVIGDPAYRELPVQTILDNQWHHLCVIWSSIEGRFWHYIDRRLISTGSRFQNGYEIPPGGTLVLGQEQDSMGGNFDQAEAFVGRLAGFTMWPRVLSPGEISWISTGKGLPRGVLLSLDDVDKLRGSVQRVTCECLEHCP
ncbi:pentraxin-4 [Alosa alosa]|uniref:pentraxin-4 n=1 Tax=Alosa alosa TaxID=278164 RepID=UPI002015054C|nr:pentraxin-4 [Alosa alosa]